MEMTNALYPEISIRMSELKNEKGVWRQRKAVTGFARYSKITKSASSRLRKQYIKLK
jgi:hypothetical protein